MLLLIFLLTLLPYTLSLPNPTPTLYPPITAYLPPSPRPFTTNTTGPSICTRPYWKNTWTFSLTIRNKNKLEKSALGTGFFDNVDADCNGVIWPSNPTPLAKVGGRVTAYYLWLEVDHGEAYGGCVEKAIQQAEDQTVVCEVVPSPCGPDASQCGV